MKKKAPLRPEQVQEAMSATALLFVLLALLRPERSLWLGLSLLVLVVGLLFKPIAKKWARLWYALPEKLSPIMTVFFLGVFFYIVLCPIALAGRIRSYDPLLLKKSKERKSTWQNRRITYQARDFEKEW